ncbi:MAG: ATP-binding cassette domain-containing protein [Thermoplasmatota archaeon]
MERRSRDDPRDADEAAPRRGAPLTAWVREGATWRRAAPASPDPVLRRLDERGFVVYEGPEAEAPKREARLDGPTLAPRKIAPNGHPAVLIQDLSKSFGDFQAVKGISLRVEEGEMFGILGPNGAGKTTTIMMLTTMLRPTGGDAIVAGSSIRSDPDGVRSKIGVVFQAQSLDRRLSARENLWLHGRLYKVPRKTLEQRIPELLALVQLTDRAEENVRGFSGGMRRRLELARGLLHEPKVLFLDEPTQGLDPQSRRNIWDYIRRLNRERGVTVVLTTHYLEEADNLCDRLAIIDHGALTSEGSPSDLKARLGGDLVELELDGDAATVAPAMRSHPNVLTAEGRGRHLRVTVRDAAETIPDLFETLTAEGATVRRVVHKPPTLDDVFLSKTGRANRDTKGKKRSAWRKRLDKLIALGKD